MEKLPDRLEEMLMTKLKEQNAHFPIINKNYSLAEKESYIMELKRKMNVLKK